MWNHSTYAHTSIRTHPHPHSHSEWCCNTHAHAEPLYKGHSRLRNLSNEDSGCCPNKISSCVQIYDTEFGTPLYKAAAHKHTAAGQDWTNRICSGSLVILPQTRLLHWNSAEQPGERSLCPIDREPVIASPVIPNKRCHRQLGSAAVLVDVYYYMLFYLWLWWIQVTCSHMQHATCLAGEWGAHSAWWVVFITSVIGNILEGPAYNLVYLIIEAVCHGQLVFFCILCNGFSSW